MSSQIAITLRAKKLGILIRDARESAGKTKKECGEAIGASSATISSIEAGRKSPSLPELELLANFLKVPVEQFFRDEVRSSAPDLLDNIHIEHTLSLRNRDIGEILATARTQANMTYKELQEETGISAARMKKYESGERAMPLPELELLTTLLKIRLTDFTNPETPIGQWIIEQRAIADFRRLSPSLQEFVSTPINKPYLELAQRLSSLSTSELRAVAEGLLEITI